MGLIFPQQLLALFESSAHPTHSLDRLSAALVTLDGIISVLNLTCLDVSDRAATHFGARHVPVASDDAPKPAKCTCISHNTLPADHFSSSWTYSPPWDPAWNPTEVRNEECRRLCWCALNLVAAFTAQCAVFQRETPDFFLANSANVSLSVVHQRCTSLDRYLNPVCSFLPWGVHVSCFRPHTPWPVAPVAQRFSLGDLLPQHAAVELLPQASQGKLQ